MIVSQIAAIGTNRELGKSNALLWNLPTEMQYFRATTKGHAVIMGRKTFESIGRALPNRRNIVITRDTNFASEGVEVAHSVDEALALFKDSNEEVFIIGGAQIYGEAMPKTDRLYITRVKSTFDADTFYPAFDETEWNKIKSEDHFADTDHAYDYTFEVWERK